MLDRHGLADELLHLHAHVTASLDTSGPTPAITATLDRLAGLAAALLGDDPPTRAHARDLLTGCAVDMPNVAPDLLALAHDATEPLIHAP